MKLVELLESTNKGLFERINEIEPLPLEMDAVQTDLNFSFSHGEKLLTRTVLNMIDRNGEEITLDRLATMLSSRFSDKWKRQGELLKIDVIGKQRTIDETVGENQKNDSNQKLENKVSAYDSDVLLTDNGKEVTNNGKIENERVRTYEENTVYSIQIASSIKNLQNNTLPSIMFLDIVETICCLIY